MEITELIRTHYPNAKTGSEITETYLDLLAGEYKTKLSKMLFATSVCSDDINVSTDFRRVLKRPFTKGGLGGLPYTGYTGMASFSQHIPDGGEGLIFYGPHVGITDEGELGKLRRIGQKRITNCCGALMAALSRIMSSDGTKPGTLKKYPESDQQQNELERTLIPYREKIISSENPVKSITDAAYEEIHSRILKLVELAKGEFNCGRVFLLGGVIINTSQGYNDFVDLRNFDVIEVG
ncbi:MAG: hypothetical protein HUU54_06740 [Ignavibacteriaceae bacterium]|nr:hypothetical protein [Ignavibacteriaceae bacterium]